MMPRKSSSSPKPRSPRSPRPQTPRQKSPSESGSKASSSKRPPQTPRQKSPSESGSKASSSKRPPQTARQKSPSESGSKASSSKRPSSSSSDRKAKAPTSRKASYQGPSTKKSPSRERPRSHNSPKNTPRSKASPNNTPRSKASPKNTPRSKPGTPSPPKLPGQLSPGQSHEEPAMSAVRQPDLHTPVPSEFADTVHTEQHVAESTGTVQKPNEVAQHKTEFDTNFAECPVAFDVHFTSRQTAVGNSSQKNSNLHNEELQKEVMELSSEADSTQNEKGYQAGIQVPSSVQQNEKQTPQQEETRELQPATFNVSFHKREQGTEASSKTTEEVPTSNKDKPLTLLGSSSPQQPSSVAISESRVATTTEEVPTSNKDKPLTLLGSSSPQQPSSVAISESRVATTTEEVPTNKDKPLTLLGSSSAQQPSSVARSGISGVATTTEEVPTSNKDKPLTLLGSSAQQPSSVARSESRVATTTEEVPTSNKDKPLLLGSSAQQPSSVEVLSRVATTTEEVPTSNKDKPLTLLGSSAQQPRFVEVLSRAATTRWTVHSFQAPVVYRTAAIDPDGNANYLQLTENPAVDALPDDIYYHSTDNLHISPTSLSENEKESVLQNQNQRNRTDEKDSGPAKAEHHSPTAKFSHSPTSKFSKPSTLVPTENEAFTTSVPLRSAVIGRPTTDEPEAPFTKRSHKRTVYTSAQNSSAKKSEDVRKKRRRQPESGLERPSTTEFCHPLGNVEEQKVRRGVAITQSDRSLECHTRRFEVPTVTNQDTLSTSSFTEPTTDGTTDMSSRITLLNSIQEDPTRQHSFESETMPNHGCCIESGHGSEVFLQQAVMQSSSVELQHSLDSALQELRVSEGLLHKRVLNLRDTVYGGGECSTANSGTRVLLTNLQDVEGMLRRELVTLESAFVAASYVPAAVAPSRLLMSVNSTDLGASPCSDVSRPSTPTSYYRSEEDHPDRWTWCQRLKQKWQDPRFRRKFCYTAWIGAALGTLGLALGQRGAAFLDLLLITNTRLEKATFYLTAFSAGWVGGCLLLGAIYGRVDRKLLLMLAILGMAVTTATLPWCSSFISMIIIHFVHACFAGFVATASNTEVMRTWMREADLPMHFISFVFALGGVLGPLYTEPFLAKQGFPLSDVPRDVNVTSKSTVNNSFVSNIQSTLNSVITVTTIISKPHFTITAKPLDDVLKTSDDVAGSDDVNVTYVHSAFAITAGLMLMCTVPFVIALWKEKKRKRKKQKRLQNETEDGATIVVPSNVTNVTTLESSGDRGRLTSLSGLTYTVVLCGMSMFYFLNICIEVTFYSLLFTYLVQQLGWGKSNAASATSLFWSTFAAGRFLSMFTAGRMSPRVLLLLSLLGLAGSFLVFLVLSSFYQVWEFSKTGVWVTVAIVGLTLAPVFPTGFAFMQDEMFHVTAKVVSLMMVVGSLGPAVNPTFLGYLMDRYTKLWFIYTLFGESVLLLLVYFALLVFARFWLRGANSAAVQQERMMVVSVVNCDATAAKMRNNNILNDNNN